MPKEKIPRMRDWKEILHKIDTLKHTKQEICNRIPYSADVPRDIERIKIIDDRILMLEWVLLIKHSEHTIIG